MRSILPVLFLFFLLKTTVGLAQISVFPYFEDFEGGAGGWVSGGTASDWALGSPSKPVITGPASGANCWITGGLTGQFYNFSQRSWVESPVFNFTNLARPQVALKIWWECEYQFDGSNLQYSTNGGATWLNVGIVNEPPSCFTENWYNRSPITNLTGLANPRDGWSGNIQATMGNCLGGNGSGGWLTAKHCLTGLGGLPSVKLRVTFGSGSTCNNYDGVAFDDILVENSPQPAANFTAVCAGNTFSFTDNSTPCINAWTWNFGDPASGASNTSILENPSHTYNSPGIYTVSHTATNSCGGTSMPVTMAVIVLGGTISGTPVSCNSANGGTPNGTATINPLPANTPNLTIEWNTSPPQNGPTATGLEAGVYEVTLTAPNACPFTTMVTITEPPPINHSVTVVAATCDNANGSATILVSGGTAPFIFLWSPSGGPGASSGGLAPGDYQVTITDSKGCTDLAEFTILNTPGVEATIPIQQDVSCFGGKNGSATAVGIGGTPPYQFLWSNPAPGGTTSTISNLAAGLYTVTITDNKNCTSTEFVLITQPDELQNTVSIQPATCGNSNGSATITVSGGTPNYSFNWQPTGGSNSSASGLAAGNYQVPILDSEGCKDTAFITIGNIAGPAASISNTSSVDCFAGNNGSATVSLAGGTPVFSYLWMPGGANLPTANNLPAGPATVTVTDANGCTATATTTISQPTEMTHSVQIQNAICGNANGSATVNETGGTPPYSFNWSPSGGSNASATGLLPGNYVVSILDNKGCLDTAHVQIGNSGGPSILMLAGQNVACFGENSGSATVSISGGLAPIIFNWSNGASGPTAPNLPAGPISVTVSDANGCTASAAATITQPTDLQHVTSSMQAACGASDGSATVVETGGAGPYSFQWSPVGGTNSTATGLPAGVYIVSILDSNGCLDTAVVTVTNPTGLTLTVQNSSPVTCFSGNDGSASVVASNGQMPYVFSWNSPLGSGTSAANLPAGLYAVTVTDASLCSATAAISIAQPADFQHVISKTPAACGNSNGSASIQTTGGTGAISFTWNPSGGSNSTASNLPPGNYVVSISDQNGCSDTVQIQILNVAGPTISISATQNVACFSGQNGSATAAVLGGTAPFSFAWPTGSTTATVLNLPAGQFIVTVTDDLNCTATATANITQPVELQHITTATASTCGLANGSATVNESGGTPPFSYIWNPTGGSAATAMNLQPGNFTVSIVDNNGCLDTAQVQIGSFLGPTISISATQNVACFSGNNGSATASILGGTSPFIFNWTSGSTTATTPNLPAGQFTVTVSDSNNCTATTTANITQPADLQHVVSIVHTTCGLPNGSATIVESGGTGGYVFTWPPPANATTTNVATNLPPGNYVVSIADANGCQDTVHLQIQNIFGVTASISATSPVSCFGGNNGSATAAATGGLAPISFKWTTGATSATALNLPAGQVVVTITDGSGCTSTATATVTQPTALMHTTSSLSATCGNPNGSATVVETGGTGPYSFLWNPSGQTGSTATGLLPGNYQVSISDANGCKETVQIQVGNVAGPQVSISILQNVSCAGGSDGSASATTTGGTAPIGFTWSNGGNSATVSNLFPGNIQVTATDANGCTSVSTNFVSEPTVISNSIFTQDVTCIGSNGQALITPTGGIPNAFGTYSFAWNPAGPTGNSASNLTPGSYSVTITDSKGCTSLASFSIGTAASVSVSIAATQPTCFNTNDGFLTATAVGGASPYTVQWSNFWTDFLNPNLSNGQFSVTVFDATGCSATASSVLFVEPVSSFWLPENVVCFDEKTGSIELDTTVGGTPPFSYAIDNQPFATGELFLGLPAGEFQLFTKDVNGCVAADTVLLTEPLPFTVDVGLDTTLFLGDELLQIGQVSDPFRATDFAWSPALEVACDSCLVTNSRPLESGDFTILVSDANGCTASDSRRVEVILPPIYIPNSFSPDFDGRNDFFTVYGGEGIDEIETMKVFDRWGDLVFERNAFQPSDDLLGWDGVSRAKTASVSVFVYWVRVRFIDGSTRVFKGDVTVVK